jgi:hypothetical protein
MYEKELEGNCHGVCMEGLCVVPEWFQKAVLSYRSLACRNFATKTSIGTRWRLKVYALRAGGGFWRVTTSQVYEFFTEQKYQIWDPVSVCLT